MGQAAWGAGVGRTTRSEGHHFLNSLSQEGSTESGHTTRCGPAGKPAGLSCRYDSSAMVCSVLPRPWRGRKGRPERGQPARGSAGRWRGGGRRRGSGAGGGRRWQGGGAGTGGGFREWRHHLVSQDGGGAVVPHGRQPLDALLLVLPQLGGEARRRRACWRRRRCARSRCGGAQPAHRGGRHEGLQRVEVRGQVASARRLRSQPRRVDAPVVRHA